MNAAPPQLRVGIVGTGRVGCVLGAALNDAGHRVVKASGVSEVSLRLAARWLPDVPLCPPDEVVSDVDLVLLTVPDDALRGLVSGLAAAQAWHPGTLVAHTSGAHGIGVLDAAAARGVVALALHPVMTFTGRPEDAQRLTGVPFGVTAQEEMRPVAEALVMQLGGEPIWVPELARAAYHTALSLGANYLVTIVNDSLDILETAGIDEVPRLMAPLLSAALDNVLRLRDGALTGPVSRGDASTVALHLDQLRAGAPQIVETYRTLARRTAERAQAAGQLRPEARAAIEEVLDRQ